MSTVDEPDAELSTTGIGVRGDANRSGLRPASLRDEDFAALTRDDLLERVAALGPTLLGDEFADNPAEIVVEDPDGRPLLWGLTRLNVGWGEDADGRWLRNTARMER